MDDQNQHLQSEEDLEAILNLAIRVQGKDTRELRQRLHDSAVELGIPPEDLLKAEEEYKAKKEAAALEVKQRQETRELRKRRVKGLVGHWVPFLMVNIFLHFINWKFSSHSYWAIWPLIGWGIGMVSHTMSVLFPSEEENQTVDERSKQLVLETNLRRRGYTYTKDGQEIRVTIGKPKDDQ